MRQRWALDSIDKFLEFLEGLGTPDVVEFIKLHPKLRYTSYSSVTEVLMSINSCLEEELLDALRKADMYSLLADESSDDSHREQFAILCRFSFKCKVDDYYLGLIEVTGTDSASLMEAIERFLMAKGIDITKAVFVGFDGCNTMSGENKGNIIIHFVFPC